MSVKASPEQFFQTRLILTDEESNSETRKLPWDETVVWIMDQLFKTPCRWPLWRMMEAPGSARGTHSNSVCASTGTSLLPPDAQTENLWSWTSYELSRVGCCTAHYREKSRFAAKTEKKHYHKKAPVNQSTNRKQGTRSCSICFLSCTVPLLNNWHPWTQPEFCCTKQH